LQTGLQTEALICPNCKEEVPKTLYCLNCGYPLYKIEMESEPAAEEDAPEPEAVETEPVIEVESVEEVVEVMEVVPEPQAHVVPIEVEEETVEITLELPAPIEAESEQVEIVEPTSEPIAVIEPESVEEDVIVRVDSIEETTEEPETIEPVVEEIINYKPAMEPISEAVTKETVEYEAPVTEFVVPELEPVEAEEIFEPDPVALPEHDPDPVIKEVMENLAKNISMKIKLVDLLRTGGVKPEIFKKLFESYLDRGELLMNSRSEMLERVRYDLGSMEKALHEAKEGLEELEIRRTIDDVSEEEYAAKAPGFQWDIGQYKDEVGKKQAEIYYLEDITRVMTPEEISELVGIGEGCFENLDELIESEAIDGENAAKVRVSLEEALACIR
jgi:hypothetical protein